MRISSRLTILAAASALALASGAAQAQTPQPEAAVTPAPVVPPAPVLEPAPEVSAAQQATLDAVNAADPIAVKSAAKPAKGAFAPALLRTQILLDRAMFSPGAIDGLGGKNTNSAVRAYAAARGLGNKDALTEAVWQSLSSADAAPALKAYAITAEDVAGPFLAPQPTKFEDMAKADAMSFASPKEALAERFHMDQALLEKLNPGADFSKAGQVILVAAVGQPNLAAGSVGRVIVDKKGGDVEAYDTMGRLLAHFPATIGSKERPAPSGAAQVRAVAPNPNYTYDPARLTWGPAEAGKLVIAPGPNNPVGGTWIDLSVDGYGIHGTPSPTLIGKSESHGCVRLTNWDAKLLAEGVKAGTPVEFE